MADPTPSQCVPRRNSRLRKLRPLAVDARRLALLLSLGLRTIRTMDAAGKLPAPVRCGSRKLWPVAEVRAWLAAGCPDRETWAHIRAATR